MARLRWQHQPNNCITWSCTAVLLARLSVRVARCVRRMGRTPRGTARRAVRAARSSSVVAAAGRTLAVASPARPCKFTEMMR